VTHQERSYKTIATLVPDFAKRVKDWYEACIDSGIQLLIYCGYRSFEEQEKLYRQGRSEAGRVVTNARGGQSFHNYGRAIDFVPFNNGKTEWDDTKTYKKAQEIAKRHNLRAISWETPHLEDGNYKSWRDLNLPVKKQNVEIPHAKDMPRKTRRVGGRGINPR
jgi:hypothetical protein